MSAGRYCVITPEPTRCRENTIMLDPESTGGARYVALMEGQGYLILPEAEALTEYDACPVDPNAP